MRFALGMDNREIARALGNPKCAAQWNVPARAFAFSHPTVRISIRSNRRSETESGPACCQTAERQVIDLVAIALTLFTPTECRHYVRHAAIGSLYKL